MKKRRDWLVLAILAGFLAGGVWYGFHNRMRYDAIEIQIPAGFENPHSLQLNDAGTVAGVVTLSADKSQHVFFWDRNDGFRDMDNLGIEGEDISLSDMNNAGQIIGLHRVPEPMTEEAHQSGIKPRLYMHSFFYDPAGGLKEILPTPGRDWPWAMAINNLGQVVGVDVIRSMNNLHHSVFLWSLEGGGESIKVDGFPHDINDSGHIVGDSSQPHNGFFWSTETGLRDIDEILKGNQIWMRINNADQVIGLYGRDHNRYRPFQWKPDQGFRNLGPQISGQSWITDITDIGSYCLSVRQSVRLPLGLGDRQEEYSFVFTPGRLKTNLNRTFSKQNFNFSAADMNNNGWILGIASEKQTSRSQGLFLLIPKNYPKRR